jgi:glutamate formiminotransferase / 5-formyltetrahydrofolate cyclo-ligase
LAPFSLVRVTSRLLAVPNVTEGRDADVVARLIEALVRSDGKPNREQDPHADARVELLDVHVDPDHDRSVFSFSAPRTELADAMLRLARVAVASVDVVSAPARGQHPHVGALDVAPVVYLDAATRGAACAEALVVADRIAYELEVPVFLYGELAGGRARAQLRRGGVRALAGRLAAAAAGEVAQPGASDGPVRPDFGPTRLHPTAGATLVAAREPLVAFNVKLSAPADLRQARRIAEAIREGGQEGLPGVRALGIALSDGSAQVSTNIERPLEVPLVTVLNAVARRAAVESAQLVGLAPTAALDGFPRDVVLEGFDPERHLIENALRSYGGSGTS